MFDTCSFKPQSYWLTFDPTQASGTPISEFLEYSADITEHVCNNTSREFVYGQITTACGYIKEDRGFRRVVAFRRVGEAPVIFSLKPFTTTFKTQALIFHSNILYRDPATNKWLQSTNPEHSRLMKVSKPNAGAICEIKFLLSQQGSLGFGYTDGRLYIDMSRCPGCNLYEWIQTQEQGQGLSCNTKMNLSHLLLTQLCTYVSAELIHPDLKPSNILYDESNNSITFIDFHFIRCHSEKLPDHLKQAMITSTRSYRAPEQAAANEASFQSMVYTMGIILTNLWSDSPASMAAASTDHDAPFGAVINDEYCFQTLRKKAPSLALDLRGLLHRMVMYKPFDRLSSHQALEKFESIRKSWEDSQGASKDV